MNQTTLTNPRIEPRSLAQMLERGEPVQLIDVRSPREYEEAHVPGAINVPLEQVESRLSDLRPGQPAVLICQSGRRADMCRTILENHRDDLIVLEGGTSAWIKEGLPIVRGTANRLPLMRQVQLVVGTAVLASTLAAYFVDPAWGFIATFMGAGLVVAGATGFCGLANLLALLPWNKAAKCSSPANAETCGGR